MTDAEDAMKRAIRVWLATKARPARRLVRAAALVAGLAVLALSGCRSSPPPAPPDPISDSATAADGGQIRVVEFGFQPVALLPHSGETNRALAAVVLENTSKRQQAQFTDLNIQLFDSDGRSLFDPGGSPAPGPRVTLTAIPPGGRIGAGALLMTEDAAARNRTAVRMEVTVGKSDWRRPNDKPEIKISDVKGVPHSDGTIDITYTAQVPDLGRWADAQLPRVHVLFRDAGGRLLGGTGLSRSYTDPWKAGTATRDIHFTAEQWKYLMPTGVDLSRTEVYGSIDGG
jgi:hypothetical protein